jgi:hypothetical protein
MSTTPKYLDLKEAAALFPGRPPHVNSIKRHILLGNRGRNGQRIRLKALKSSGRWFVTAEAVAEFLKAVTADALGEAPADPKAKESDRKRRAAEAGRALEKLGA